MIVSKKNKKIWICVNKKKVNAATIRFDHHPLFFIGHKVKRVVVIELLKILDVFLGYNQVQIDSNDHKMTFRMEWDTYFEYNIMHFGLTNAPLTFQRLMSTNFF